MLGPDRRATPDSPGVLTMKLLIALAVAGVSAAFTSSASAEVSSLCIPILMNCDDHGTPGSAGGAAADLPGQWTQDSFANSAGSRNFYLYVPKSAPSGKPAGVMVMLHGCLQDAASFSRQTGMNYIAEKYGFAVIYPEQTFSDNVMRCWNWFRPENQVHGGGELSIVVGMVNKVIQQTSADARRVFVAGISAGGAMASNLVACHADLFSGAGVHSGLEFKAATSEAEAHSVLKGGSSHDLRQIGIEAAECTGAKVKPLAIVTFHGKADPFVGTVNSDRVIEQFTQTNDLLDDGRDNDSQTTTVINTRRETVNGYDTTFETFGGGGKVRLQKVSIDKLSHAWSGAHEAAQYADVKGPNASEIIWTFLSQTPRK